MWRYDSWIWWFFLTEMISCRVYSPRLRLSSGIDWRKNKVITNERTIPLLIKSGQFRILYLSLNCFRLCLKSAFDGLEDSTNFFRYKSLRFFTFFLRIARTWLSSREYSDSDLHAFCQISISCWISTTWKIIFIIYHKYSPYYYYSNYDGSFEIKFWLWISSDSARPQKDPTDRETMYFVPFKSPLLNSLWEKSFLNELNTTCNYSIVHVCNRYFRF